MSSAVEQKLGAAVSDSDHLRSARNSKLGSEGLLLSPQKGRTVRCWGRTGRAPDGPNWWSEWSARVEQIRVPSFLLLLVARFAELT
jgi:hypothetical protein